MQTKIGIKSYENGLWKVKKTVFGKANTEFKRCVYSSISSAADHTETVILRYFTKAGRENAFDINGAHYVIVSAIPDEKKNFTTFLCAKALLKRCEMDFFTTAKDSLNRIVKTRVKTEVFDAVLAEKYAGYEKNTPIQTASEGVVLIVPKSKTLALGEVVKIDSVFYAVKTRHETGEFQNEYEIEAKRDF